LTFVDSTLSRLNLGRQRRNSARELIVVFLQLFLKCADQNLLAKAAKNTLKVGIFRLQTALKL
jgi:hypothetical protein